MDLIRFQKTLFNSLLTDIAIAVPTRINFLLLREPAVTVPSVLDHDVALRSGPKIAN